VASGTAYAISVAAEPSSPAQTCVVSNGTNTVGAANVTSINVQCTTNTYKLGGSADITNVTVTCTSLISAANAASVTALGDSLNETVMQLASFLGERLTWRSGHLSASATETCSDPYHEVTGGQAAYIFSDNDASGSLTQGDTITITLTGCLSQSMADNVSGTVADNSSAVVSLGPNDSGSFFPLDQDLFWSRVSMASPGGSPAVTASSRPTRGPLT
jgi:hypothetical protein